MHLHLAAARGSVRDVSSADNHYALGKLGCTIKLHLQKIRDSTMDTTFCCRYPAQ